MGPQLQYVLDHWPFAVAGLGAVVFLSVWLVQLAAGRAEARDAEAAEDEAITESLVADVTLVQEYVPGVGWVAQERPVPAGAAVRGEAPEADQEPEEREGEGPFTIQAQSFAGESLRLPPVASAVAEEPLPTLPAADLTGGDRGVVLAAFGGGPATGAEARADVPSPAEAVPVPMMTEGGAGGATAELTDAEADSGSEVAEVAADEREAPERRSDPDAAGDALEYSADFDQSARPLPRRERGAHVREETTRAAMPEAENAAVPSLEPEQAETKTPGQGPDLVESLPFAGAHALAGIAQAAESAYYTGHHAADSPAVVDEDDSALGTAPSAEADREYEVTPGGHGLALELAHPFRGDHALGEAPASDGYTPWEAAAAPSYATEESPAPTYPAANPTEAPADDALETAPAAATWITADPPSAFGHGPALEAAYPFAGTHTLQTPDPGYVPATAYSPEHAAADFTEVGDTPPGGPNSGDAPAPERAPAVMTRKMLRDLERQGLSLPVESGELFQQHPVADAAPFNTYTAEAPEGGEEFAAAAPPRGWWAGRKARKAATKASKADDARRIEAREWLDTIPDTGHGLAPTPWPATAGPGGYSTEDTPLVQTQTGTADDSATLAPLPAAANPYTHPGEGEQWSYGHVPSPDEPLTAEGTSAGSPTDGAVDELGMPGADAAPAFPTYYNPTTAQLDEDAVDDLTQEPSGHAPFTAPAPLDPFAAPAPADPFAQEAGAGDLAPEWAMSLPAPIWDAAPESEPGTDEQDTPTWAPAAPAPAWAPAAEVANTGGPEWAPQSYGTVDPAPAPSDPHLGQPYPVLASPADEQGWAPAQEEAAHPEPALVNDWSEQAALEAAELAASESEAQRAAEISAAQARMAARDADVADRRQADADRRADHDHERAEKERTRRADEARKAADKQARRDEAERETSRKQAQREAASAERESQKAARKEGRDAKWKRRSHADSEGTAALRAASAQILAQAASQAPTAAQATGGPLDLGHAGPIELPDVQQHASGEAVVEASQFVIGASRRQTADLDHVSYDLPEALPRAMHAAPPL